MTSGDTAFTGSVPENYERYMVPLIFAPYATDLARRAVGLGPRDVLETAAGSGAVTRALAPLLPEARYVATDLNPPMIAHAAKLQPAEPRVVWQAADALALPFADACFDLVVCQFGAMFFPDRFAGFREARRVLRPGGRLLFNVWDRIQENVFADEVTQALAALFPDDPPRFLARTPHGYFDTDVIRRDVLAAGFPEVMIETVAAQSAATSVEVPELAYCQGTVLRAEIEARAPGQLAAVTAQVVARLGALHGSGPVSAKIQAHVVLASG